MPELASSLRPTLVSAESLNIRSAPSAQSPPVGVLRRGQVVEVLALSDDARWALIARKPAPGWVSQKYLTNVPLLAPRSEEYPWMPIALHEIGQREVTGSGDNPRIVEYHRSTRLDLDLAQHDETHWCSSFANWCVERSGYAGTDSAAAVSWLSWGKPLKKPRRGCITVLSRKGGHHVGFFVRSDRPSAESAQLLLLGGNQGDAVSIDSYDLGRVIGYRVPR